MELSISGARILATFENVPLLGTVHLTQTLVVSWLVMLILTVLCVWLGSGLRVTNISRKQAVAEMAVSSLVKFVHDNMGTEFDRYIPLVGTIFATSVVSNLISLLGIWSPTADLMTELGWALVVFVLITYHKIKSSGIGGYLKGFLDPIFIMAPSNVMSELFTPGHQRFDLRRSDRGKLRTAERTGLRASCRHRCNRRWHCTGLSGKEKKQKGAPDYWYHHGCVGNTGASQQSRRCVRQIPLAGCWHSRYYQFLF